MSGVMIAALQWRPCRLSDVDGLVALEQRLYSHPWTRANFVDSLEGGHWAWHAGLDDRAPEFVVYWIAMPVLDELHLLNIAVHPEYWGQGLAQRGLVHLMEQAKSRDMNEVWLEVRESNQRAQALYLRNGFTTVGRRRAYYPGGPKGRHDREDALLMRKGLRGTP